MQKANLLLENPTLRTRGSYDRMVNDDDDDDGDDDDDDDGDVDN